MTIVERVEKALEYLKNPENANKIQEIQNYTGILGQYMGALGGHPSMIAHYSVFLQQSIPILLNLCSHNSTEIRLVADEALNRVVIGGIPFHSSKVHLHLHNNLTSDKHPRWLRAAISRICLGQSWLRAGAGRGRIFAQSTLIRLRDIVENLKDPSIVTEKGDTLLMECLETNLPRIMKALSPFATKDEMFGLLTAFTGLVDSPTPSIRRHAANCIAELCQYYPKKFICYITNLALNALQEKMSTPDSILGWFGTLRAMFFVNPISNLASDVVPIVKYMMIYQICLYHIDVTLNNHNIINAALDCLNVILMDANSIIRSSLLNPEGPVCLLNIKEKSNSKGHQRSLSSVSMVQSVMSTASSMANISDDVLISEQSETITFQDSIYIGSVSQNQTPHRSMEDLHLKGINTPDSPCESMISELNSEIMTNEQFSLYVKEKLYEKAEEKEVEEKDNLHVFEDNYNTQSCKDINQKINIGSFNDPDIPLKYCARLLVSRFLLAGYSGKTIPDQIVRVSVKASAISCLSSILDIYPEMLTLYMGIQNDNTHNLSGNSEYSSGSNNEQLNDFILERNVCYQESLTDSFGQELLTKSIDMMSQTSGTGSNKSGNSQPQSSSAQKREKFKTNVLDSVDNNSSTGGIPVNVSDTKNVVNQTNNQMISSCLSGDSMNLAMTGSNFTVGSTTASNYPASTDLLTTSIDPLTSSLDLEMIFDHFGESSNIGENLTQSTEIDKKQSKTFNLEQMIHGMYVSQENVKYDKQMSNESDKSHGKVENVDNSPKMVQSEKNKSENDSVRKENVHVECVLHENVNKEEIVRDNSAVLNQHISEFIFLLENHSDPQIRGLIRICIGTFLNSVFDASFGDYYKWKSWSNISKSMASNMIVENLLNIILTGLTDPIHSCVNNSILALEKCVGSICNGCQRVIVDILNNLRHVENNSYWLCKVNLCHFYQKLDYQKLNVLVPDWPSRGFRILDILIKILGDQDQRVRKAAVETIRMLPSSLFSRLNFDPSNILTNLIIEKTEDMLFLNVKESTKLLSDFRHTFVFSVLPEPLKQLNGTQDNMYLVKNDILYSNLKCIIQILSYNLMKSQCKYFTQGCLETLLDLSVKYSPTKYFHAYTGLGLLDISLELLEYRTLSLSCFETTLELVTQLYGVEAWNIICKSYNSDIKQLSKLDVKDPNFQKSWSHMGPGTFYLKSESLLKLTLKLLNIFIHIIQDVSPQIIQQRTGIIPPSPIRRKSGEDNQKRSTSPNYDIPATDDKSSQRKRSHYNPITSNVIPMGYFVNDVILMKLYANLKSAYSTHKVTVDPSSSVFLNFVSKTLDSLTIQLEVMSEKEAGKFAEEILFYLKCLLPLKPDKSVSCVIQLLRCLFSINMSSQCNSLQIFLKESDSVNEKNKWDDHGEAKKCKFYDNVLLANCDNGVSFDSVMNYNDKLFTHISDSSDNNLNHRIVEGYGKNSHLQNERDCYLSIKNYNRHRSDKEWTTHKHEFLKYIKLIEPIVIQALKSYTVQNNVPMQCKVLELLNQLLALRINYCFLNSDRVFIDFVLKQLENIEHQEILNCGELVRCIFTFLVHLSSGEHHTKQLMDIPKLIQLCDGLMASEAYAECIESLHPLAYKIFVSQQQIPGQSRQQVQEAQATKEVLFAMLQKMMRDSKVIKLVSTVLIFSEEHPESHYKLSQLTCDTLFQLLRQKSIDINSPESYVVLDKLFDCIHREILFDQSKIEAALRIMFDKPPNQEYSSMEVKERWLATMLLFLRKIVYGMAENEILLSLNYLKTSSISPTSIFFNSQDEIDPLNVQTVNENCANLSPDVIFIRFLFRVITYALLEIENCTKKDLSADVKVSSGRLSYWYKLTVGFICQVKHILYLKDGCRFPLLAKTAQTVLQNEQSGLNTGLYSPEENIPLKRLASICTKLSWTQPLLAVQWCHLLVRLKFIEQKFWGSLLGFLQNSVMPPEKDSQRNLHNDILQLGCFLTLCEHFVDNGLDEVINLTWLLVNRIHFLIRCYNESIVKEFLCKVNENPSASGLLLQAIAARCQPYMKGMYGIKVYKILSKCHMTQSGALLFCICRFIGRINVSISSYFVKLAIKRCQYILSLTIEEANSQIPLDDLQMAMEMLHKDRVDKRHPNLVDELNNLASSIYNLSPLDMPLDRHINPQNIITTSVDNDWFLTQIKNRCSKYSNGQINFGRHAAIAKVLKSLSSEELASIFNSNEFDTEILQQTLKLGVESFIKELINKISDQEYVKIEARRDKIKKCVSEHEEYSMKENIIDSNIFPDLTKLKRIGRQSRFFVSIENPSEKKLESVKYETCSHDEKMDIVIPEFSPTLSLSLKHLQKMLQSVISLFPKHSRPSSQFESVNLKEYHTMDKYTKRCYLVFRDGVFHQLLSLGQNLVKSYLKCFNSVMMVLDKMDPDVVDKIIELFLPKNLSSSLMLFSVISLQYTSYLIKQDEDSSLIDNNGSFKNDMNYVDHIIDLCVENASQCFNINSVWKELNAEENTTRVLSTINCFYNYMTYVLKNTLPIKFVKNVSERESSEVVLETAIICDKLLTLLEYWNVNFSHKSTCKRDAVISSKMKDNLETLLIRLCRCRFASSFTLIPPMAWGDLQLFEDISINQNVSNTDTPKTHSRNPSKTDSIKSERIFKSEIALPIDSLQDMDMLEQFLFRVNLIGWTSKKGFEEIWVTFLSALQGNGTHWAIKGMMQMILSANYVYCGRDLAVASPNIKLLKQVALDCNVYDKLFRDVNLEKVPFTNSDCYNYSQVSVEYLKHSAGLNEIPDIKVQNALNQSKKELQSSGIDINSCIQFLIDVASQVLPQSDWGLGAKSALISCIVNVSDAFTSKLQWQWLSQQLSILNYSSESTDILIQSYIILGQAKVNCVLGNEIPDINQLTSALTSSFAPIRIAALHSAILYLSKTTDLSFIFMDSAVRAGYEQFNAMLEMHLLSAIKPHLVSSAVVSYNEQALCWTALFTLIKCGNNELNKIAIDFCFNNPNHFCFNLLLRGICQTTLIKGPTSANEIRTLILNILDTQPQECYRLLPLLLTQIYTSIDVQSSDSALEPEQLLAHLQTFTCLQKSVTLSPFIHSKYICASIVNCLRNFLPPAAVLSKVVQEFLDCCKWADSCYIDKQIALTKGSFGINLAPSYAELLANVVFEVFETSITQDQLTILNGWLFDVLGHLLKGKVSSSLMPFCLLCMMSCASSNTFIRLMSPIVNHTLKIGCMTMTTIERKSQNFDDVVDNILSVKPKKSQQGSNVQKMHYNDLRILCLSAIHSNFPKSQMDKLRSICVGEELLIDLQSLLNTKNTA